MKTLILFLMIFSIKSYSQDNFVKLKDFLDLTDENIIVCEDDIYVDTTGFGSLFIELPKIVLDSRYINHFYANGPFYFFKDYKNDIKLFETSKSEYTTDDISNNLIELKEKFKDIEKVSGTIIFKKNEDNNNRVNIYFESLVNCEEYREKLLFLSDDFSCSFDCYPAELLSSINTSELSIEINVTQNENTLRVLIDKSNAKNITINIFNLNGQIMNSRTNNLTGGLDYFDFDISNYLTGTYIYSISIDGYKVKSNKFNVVK